MKRADESNFSNPRNPRNVRRRSPSCPPLSVKNRDADVDVRRSAASPELQFANANANGRTAEVKVQRASDSQCLGERGTF
jgi:hypothetical protein